MPNFLNKPYRFNDDLKSNVKSIILITFTVFLFLFVFQPLNIQDLSNADRLLLITAIGIITLLSLSLNLLVLPSYLPRIFIHHEWKVWKEILWDLWILFIIALGYFVFYKGIDYFFPEKSTLIPSMDALFIIKMVLVAVVPITILVTMNRNRLLRIHLSTANELNKRLKESKDAHDRLITFESEYQKDKLSIKPRMLVLVRAADNYIEVFWRSETAINSQMIRNSMKHLDDLLQEYPFLFRCHRSYLVNVNYIDRVEGQSQGYRLFFEGLDFPVPVSKTAVGKLEEMLRLL